MSGGYLEHHNWHKKIILWQLSYWKNHVLRYNLDVMQIENNSFANIMHTILNVQGRTKDTIKSRLDLPDIFSRSELHHMINDKAPVPIYKLPIDAKTSLFN